VLDAIAQDLRYAIRSVRTNSALAVVAVLSLTLGIGANTAIFSLINAVMLRTLPVSHPEELLQVTADMPQISTNPIWQQIRALAAATTRFVSSFLYGVKPNDPVTLALAALVLTAVAAFAGYLPARRASRLEPMTALREV